MSRSVGVVVVALAVLAILAGRTDVRGDGEGQGNAHLAVTTAPIGGSVTVTLTATPGAPFLLGIDVAPGSHVFPGFGTIRLGLTPSLLFPLNSLGGGTAPFPPSGTIQITLPTGTNPGLHGVSLYSQLITVDAGAPNGFGISDPASILFSQPDTCIAISPMNEPRALHRATLLHDGRVLVTGGGTGALLSPVASNTTELYDPYTRTFAPGPLMSAPRTLHTATLLQDGRVLVTGGTLTLGAGLASAEIYDPATGTFSAAGNLSTPRAAHTATLLQDGRVLITGGASSFILNPPTSTNYGPIFAAAQDTAEIFDPATNVFSPLPAMTDKRLGHSAVLLTDGTVLVAGGIRGAQAFAATSLPLYATSSNRFDPTNQAWTALSALATPRIAFTLDETPSGAVVAAGGAGGIFVSSTSSIEILQPGAVTWSGGGNLPAAVGLHASARLPSGILLLSGGGTGAVGQFNGVADVAAFAQGAVTPRNPLPAGRQNHTATVLPDGAVLIIGGADAGGTATSSALYCTP